MTKNSRITHYVIMGFNLLFAVGLFSLYYSYYPFNPVTDYIPSTWDYAYFTWEKVILLGIYVIMFLICNDVTIRVQAIILGGFSFLRLAWQFIEWANHSFANGEFLFFVLSCFCLLAVMLSIIFPAQIALLRKYRRREWKKLKRKIKEDNGTELDMVML